MDCNKIIKEEINLLHEYQRQQNKNGCIPSTEIANTIINLILCQKRLRILR